MSTGSPPPLGKLQHDSSDNSRAIQQDSRSPGGGSGPDLGLPWPGSLARWQREGLPRGVGLAEFFDLDKIARIEVDNSPRCEERIVEETDQYKVYTTRWGAIQKDFKRADSTPGFLGYTITTPEKWQEAKRRMTPTDDRIPWDYLQENYPQWRAEGYWIDGQALLRIDSAHALTVGFETFLTAMIQDPQWCGRYVQPLSRCEYRAAGPSVGRGLHI